GSASWRPGAGWRSAELTERHLAKAFLDLLRRLQRPILADLSGVPLLERPRDALTQVAEDARLGDDVEAIELALLAPGFELRRGLFREADRVLLDRVGRCAHCVAA